MPTIDDLRSALHDHAGDVHADGVTGRAASVRDRVRTVRNRRRAGVAAGTAAVVAVVAALVLLPGAGPAPRPEPADRTLVGRTAPATITSLGYTYRFVAGYEGRSSASAKSLPSDGPRLVTWATEGDDQKVRILPPGESPRTSTAGDFADFALVPPGSTGGFLVHGDLNGNVALAVYELDTTRAPAGATERGVTFREQVGSRSLLGAAFAEPGQAELSAEVSVDAEMPAGELQASYFCAGAPEDAHVHLEIDDRGALEGPGCDDSTFDPGALADAGYVDGVGAATGETITARLWVTRGPDGPLYDDPDLRLGLGLYEAAPPVEVEGFTFPERLERDGHTWRFNGNFSASDRGARSRSSEQRGDGDLPEQLGLVLTRNLDGGRLEVIRDGEPVESLSSRMPQDWEVAVLLPGSRWKLEVRVGGGVGPTTQIALAYYERID